MHKTVETMVFWNLTKWGGVKNEISKYTAQRIKIFKSAQGVWPCGNTMQKKNRKKRFLKILPKSGDAKTEISKYTGPNGNFFLWTKVACLAEI